MGGEGGSEVNLGGRGGEGGSEVNLGGRGRGK